MKNQLLPELQQFLHSKSLISKKYIPYYANWASKFLSFSSENETLSHEVKVEEFLTHLQLNESLADWQVKQAL